MRGLEFSRAKLFQMTAVMVLALICSVDRLVLVYSYVGLYLLDLLDVYGEMDYMNHMFSILLRLNSVC
jgi:hypothetical protein